MRDQTFRDFEYIVVDHRYQRRHEEVMALAREYGVNLIHVPEFRRNAQWAVLSSGFNTGFALARGRLIILLVDWTYAPPGWIEAHLQHHSSPPQKYVLAPYTYYSQVPELILKKPFDFSTQSERADNRCTEEDDVLRGEVIPEVCAFKDGRFDPSWLSGLAKAQHPHQDTRSRAAGPGLPYTWTHLKNESVPRDIVYNLNGTDIWSERGGRMSIDTEFGIRLEMAGVQLFWEPAGHAHCINPRHSVCRVMPFGDINERIEGRWNLQDCQAYFARREAELRAGQAIKAPAPYTLDELAKRLEPWRTTSHIDVSTLDIPDNLFYGREIWPNSPYAN